MKTFYDRESRKQIDFDILGKPKRKYRKFYTAILFFVFLISLLLF